MIVLLIHVVVPSCCSDSHPLLLTSLCEHTHTRILSFGNGYVCIIIEPIFKSNTYIMYMSMANILRSLLNFPEFAGAQVEFQISTNSTHSSAAFPPLHPFSHCCCCCYRFSNCYCLYSLTNFRGTFVRSHVVCVCVFLKYTQRASCLQNF